MDLSSLKSRLVVDLGLLAASIAMFFVLPDQLGFATRVITTVLFVLSLDLVLGYAGIPTLGHAAIFGIGAYAAGLYALHVSSEPLSGLLVAGIAGAVIAFLTGLLLLRVNKLTLVMISIAMAQIALEIANQASGLTGGADGLGGFELGPVLGLFAFDFYGYTAYGYALAVTWLLFLVMRRLMASPFGISCQGVREQPRRMEALGVSVYWRLVAIYTIAGSIAGVAGGLATQTTQFVSLEVLGFTVSAEALIMLIIGGTGRLYGAIIGTILFMSAHDIAAGIAPANWLFVIGALVIVVVLVTPRGLLSILPWGSR